MGCGAYNPNSYFTNSVVICDSLSDLDNVTSLTYIDSTGSETDVSFDHSDPGLYWTWTFSDQPAGIPYYSKSVLTKECYIDSEKKNSCLLRIAYNSPNLTIPGIGSYQWMNPVLHDTDVGVTLIFKTKNKDDDVYYSDAGTLNILESIYTQYTQDNQVNAVFFGTLINDSGKKLRIKCGKYSLQKR